MTTTNSATPSDPSNPQWTTDEIDRYLLLLGKESAQLLEGAWTDFVVAAKRQGTESPQRAARCEHLLSLGPAKIRDLLLDTGDDGLRFRRVAPMYAIVPRKRREELLREAVLSGTCATVYETRWADAPSEKSLVDNIVEHLLIGMDGEPREAFTAFVAASGQTKWFIAADFVIGDETRPNDVFGFTVIPYDADIGTIQAEIADVLKRDLKATKDVSSEMIAFLRSKRRFHFAFIVNKDRKLFKTVSEARDAIDYTIKMMLNYNDAESHGESIKKVKGLRHEANANRFNSGLLADIILMAAFGGFIAALLALEGRAEVVGFFPDRDKMTTAYGAIGYETFAQNASAFALRFNVPESQIGLALPGERDDGKKGMYYDEFVRIPDYIAGAIAATDLSPPSPTGINQKSIDIVAKALIDNSNVAILRVHLPPGNLQVSCIGITSTPPI